MPRLLAPTAIDFTRYFTTGEFAIHRQTAYLRVRLARPEKWGADTTIAVMLSVSIDGAPWVCCGQATGGARWDGETGRLITRPYELGFTLPWGFFEGEVAMRLGERGSRVTARLDLVLVHGPRLATRVALDSVIAPAPRLERHHSVAGENTAGNHEYLGDGVVSLTISASDASTMGAFAGTVYQQLDGSARNSSVTYNGNAMTQLWNTQIGSSSGGSGFRIVGQATGSQTVTGTNSSASSSGSQHLVVLTMSGVDQTTPCGTPATTSGSTTASTSVTVSGVSSGNLVCDSIGWYELAFGGTSLAPGETRTKQLTEVDGSGLISCGISSLTGTGSVSPSWTWSGNVASSHYGAVEFKQASAGKASKNTRGRPLGMWAGGPRMSPPMAGVGA
jgi:hypothetical protein